MFNFLNKYNIIKRKCKAFSISNGMDKLILIAFVVFLPIISLAQGGGGVGGGDGGGGGVGADLNIGAKIKNPIPYNTINEFIKIFLEGALKIGIPVVALAIIYSGFLFVFARGNTEKLTKAKDALLYTLIGAAILLGSWAIAEMINATVVGLK